MSIPPGSDPGRPPPDISGIKPPVAMGVTGLSQLLKCYHVGTEEVRSTLLRECDVIMECKTCRSLYRGLPNFLAHKRHYCTDNYAGTLTRFQDLVSKEDEASILGTVFGESAFYASVAEAGQNIDAVRSTGQVVQLDKIAETSAAVQQTCNSSNILKRKAEDEGSQQPAKVPKLGSQQVNSSLDGVTPTPIPDSVQSMREFLSKNRFIKEANNYCVLCQISYSGRSTLNKHMKRKHLRRKVFRKCTKCPKVFLSDGRFKSHAVNAHGISLETVQRDLKTTKGLIEKIVYNNKIVFNDPVSFSFMKNQVETIEGQETMCDLTQEKEKPKSPAKAPVAQSPVKTPVAHVPAVQNIRSKDAPLNPKEGKEMMVIYILGLGITQDNLNQRFKCMIHSKCQFTRYDSYLEHIVVRHMKHTIKCPECTTIFKQRGTEPSQHFADFVQHLTSSHNMPSSCSVSEEVKMSLRQSVLVDPGEVVDIEVIYCRLCNNGYSGPSMRSSLSRHLINFHNLSPGDAQDAIENASRTAPARAIENLINGVQDDKLDKLAASLEYQVLQTIQIWHRSTTHVPVRYKCFKHTMSNFNLYETFKEHLLTKHCNTEIQCPMCKETFVHEDGLETNYFTLFVDHLSEAHHVTSEAVGEMADALRQALMLDPNEFNNLKQDRLMCPICCGGFYGSKKYLLNHMRQVHNMYSADLDNYSLSEVNADIKKVERSPSKTPVEEDKVDNEGETEPDYHLLLTLGIWGPSNSQYQKYKCFAHPSYLFKRFSSIRDHVYSVHCVEDVKCPKCDETFAAEELLIHLMESHGVNHSNVSQTELRQAMLVNPEEAEEYEGKPSTPIPQPVVCISKLDSSKTSSDTLSLKPLARRSSQSMISTFSLDDFHCPVCVRAFTKMYNLMTHLTTVHGYTKEKAMEMRDQVKKASEKWRDQNLMIANTSGSQDSEDEEEDDEENDDDEDMEVSFSSPSRRKQHSPAKAQPSEDESVSHSTPRTGAGDVPAIRKISFGVGFSLHKCGKCSKVFGREAALLDHEKSCGAESDTEGSVKSSASTAPDSKPTRNVETPEAKVCVKCNKKYLNKQSHVRYYCRGFVVSDDAHGVCKFCKRRFSKRGLIVHAKICKGIKEDVDTTDDDVASSVGSREGLSDLSPMPKQVDANGASKDVKNSCPVCHVGLANIRRHMRNVHKWNKTKTAQFFAEGRVKKEDEEEEDVDTLEEKTSEPMDRKSSRTGDESKAEHSNDDKPTDKKITDDDQEEDPAEESSTKKTPTTGLRTTRGRASDSDLTRSADTVTNGGSDGARKVKKASFIDVVITPPGKSRQRLSLPARLDA